MFIVTANRQKFTHGVVHCFTGNLQEMQDYLELGLYIGVAGVSMATPEGIEVVKQIPLDKLMLETDAPYCRITNTSAVADMVETKWNMKPKNKFKKGYLVKERNEPIRILEVLEVVAKVRGMEQSDLAEIVYQNTCKFFNIKVAEL